MIKYENKMKEITSPVVDQQLASEDIRDGLVPGWDEVCLRFELGEFSPSQQRLLHSFYRAQRWFAEKGVRGKKPRRLMQRLSPDLQRLRFTDEFTEKEENLIKEPDLDAFFNDPCFEKFEEQYGSLLTSIASFVRHPSEEKRQLLRDRIR